MYCEPRTFDAAPDHLFRNDGGRFVGRLGGGRDRRPRRPGPGRRRGRPRRRRPGRPVRGQRHDGQLPRSATWADSGSRRSGLDSGLAANAASGFLAGMGVACGDPDGDGRPDLAVTNFYDESTTLYRNLGSGFFADQTAAAGRPSPSRYLLGFGIAFLDYDNDGRLDLAIANGHVNDSRPLYPLRDARPAPGREPGRPLRRRVGRGRSALDRSRRVGRGLAAGDLDNDGKIDLLIVSQGEPLAYFHNGTAGGHFLVLRLEGTRSNRDAVGARVVVTTGGPAAGRLAVSAAAAISRPPTRGSTSAWGGRSGRVRRGVLAVGAHGSFQGPEGRCRLSLAGRPPGAPAAGRIPGRRNCAGP